MFGMPKIAGRHCEGSFSCWIRMPILRLVRPPWNHLVKSCRLRLNFVWSSVQSPRRQYEGNTKIPDRLKNGTRLREAPAIPSCRHRILVRCHRDGTTMRTKKANLSGSSFIMMDIYKASLRPSSSSLSLVHLYTDIKSFHYLQLINNYFQFISLQNFMLWWWVNWEEDGSSIAYFDTP
jgi:hypothetical protein